MPLADALRTTTEWSLVLNFFLASKRSEEEKKIAQHNGHMERVEPWQGCSKTQSAAARTHP